MGRCSVVRVEKTYQEIRKFCRKYPNPRIESLEEARLKSASLGLGEWELPPREERMLRLLCEYLGL